MATRKTKSTAQTTAIMDKADAIVTAIVSNSAPALQFIELDKIRAAAQVRTEFNDEDLAELAASIQQQGILQPVLLRPDPDAIGSYIIIAGERRVRAAHLASLAAVPALIGEVDQAKAAEMQLVENIQREELSLTDTAAAVAQLYEKHQALKPIAQLTGKSLSWVSKYLTVGRSIDWRAHALLTTGATEDLELVLLVSQIGKLAWGRPQQELFNAIERGEAGRAEARALLAKIKEEMKADKKKVDASRKKGKSAAPKKEPEWSAHVALEDLCNTTQGRDGFDLDAALSIYTPEQQGAMCATVRDQWERGNILAAASKLDAMRRMSAWMDHYPSTEEVAAYLLGANDIELTLRDLTIEMRAIMTQ